MITSQVILNTLNKSNIFFHYRRKRNERIYGFNQRPLRS